MREEKVGIWSSFRGGINRVWGNKILALLLFLFKVFFAILLVLPVYYMFSKTFSFSPSSTNFLKSFDFYLLVDFLAQWKKGINLYLVLFLVTGATSILSYVFFSGGLWGAFFLDLKEGKQKFRGEKFFGDCAKYFGSFLKILVFISIAYVAVFLISLLIFFLIQAIAGKELSLTAHISVIILEALILAILFMWVEMWSDYLRIYRIFLEEKKLRRILKPTLKFIFRNFTRAVLLYYLLTMILLGSLIAYFGLHKVLHFIFREKFLILSLFILQQAYSIFRSFYRLVYYSSQMVLFDKLVVQDKYAGQEPGSF